ncbi:MAG: hypothetical protein ABSA46_06855 [Thermodesulfovibrionales bacterium]
MESKEGGDGALAIVSYRLQHMISNSPYHTPMDAILAVNAGKWNPGDAVIANFTGILVDALINALTHIGNSALEWTVLITSPKDGQSIAGTKYSRAYFSNSLESLLSDDRFNSYIREALLLSWLAKQTSISDSFYNVLMQRGDGVFACAVMNASYHFKKILSESELTDFCQISLLRNLIKEAPVPAK